MTDKVTLTIDDVEVEVDPGTLIIRAAEQTGIRIPRFCDHPLLKPVAACRQCLVEVGTPDREGNLRMMPKPQPSCAIPVSPGMVVKTQHTSEVALKAQEGIMEFLLINHPLDCPICDKGGECPLQNQAMTEGRDDSRFIDAKRVYEKPMRLTSQIMLDRDRCILCQRCVRFVQEIPGDPFIALQGRGGGSAPTDDHHFMGEQIGSFGASVLEYHVPGVDGPKRTDISGPFGQEGIISSVYSGPELESDRDLTGRAFGSYFSGNIIQICPVGALTATSYRFKARPFDLVSIPSVTEQDASGSATRVDIRRSEVVRILSGNDPEVNEEWITDKDRFAFEWTTLDDRLKLPMIRENGELITVSWSEALNTIADKMKELDGEKPVGLLPGGRLSFEDAWAWSKFARRGLGTNNVDFRWRHQSAEEAQFLSALVAGQGLGVTYEDVEKAPEVLLVALEPEDECGSLFLRLRKRYTAGVTNVKTVAPYLTRGSRKLGATLVAAAPGDEVAALQQVELSEAAVILVGERAARTPGLLSAVASLADKTGAQMQWVPRRSGDRGAIDAGLLPTVLPFGRPVDDVEARESLGWEQVPDSVGLSAQEMLDRAAEGNMGALFVGGVDLRDWPDPAAAKDALAKADFLVSLEVRRSEVAEMADVVLPVAPAFEKNGTFINWEGRLRPFGQAYASRYMTDRDVLGMLASEMDLDLQVEDLAALYADVNPLMLWQGSRADAPHEATIAPATPAKGSLTLASHKVLVDLGRLQDGAPDLAGSARVPVALVSEKTLSDLGFEEDQMVTVSGGRGSVTLPIESCDMVESVLWLPECSFGNGVHTDLGVAGSPVTVTAAVEV